MLILKESDPTFEDFYLELLSRYTQLEKFNGLKITKVSDAQKKLMNFDVLPRLLTAEGQQLYSLQEISAHLLKQLHWDPFMIGETEEERSDCHSFFDLVATAGADHHKLLEALQNQLKENTFLTGNSGLKIADLYVFAYLFNHLVNAQAETKIKFFNVYRWFDYVQNLRGIKQNLLDMKFRLMEQIHPSEIIEHPPKPDHVHAAPEGKDHANKQQRKDAPKDQEGAAKDQAKPEGEAKQKQKQQPPKEKQAAPAQPKKEAAPAPAQPKKEAAPAPAPAPAPAK